MNAETHMNHKQNNQIKASKVKVRGWSVTIHQAYPTQPLNDYQKGTMQITFCTIKRLKER